MKNTFCCTLNRLKKEVTGFYCPKIQPLAADQWVVSSLLQKSIRRGDTKFAQEAGSSYLHHCGNSIWRRLIVIAFEDIGIGSTDLLIELVAISLNPEWREQVGGDYHIVLFMINKMTQAIKDRSSDYLICAAHEHPKLENVRSWASSLTITERIDLVTDERYTLPVRAIMAWYSSGIEWDKENRIGKGNIKSLLDTYLHLGIPDDLVLATEIAAKITHEPITIMVPLLWYEVNSSMQSSVISLSTPQSMIESGIPLYAFDMHTRIGRKSIIEFSYKNIQVNDLLSKYSIDSQRDKASLLAAFYTDGAPVKLKLDWDYSKPLENLGLESDFLSTGIERKAIPELLSCFSKNLEHLNEFRLQIYRSS